MLLDFINNTSAVSLSIIVMFTLLMLWLFCWECLSYRSKHKDFKSTIVSIGVLGTFVGIFVALWHFNSYDIATTVVALLDGLKTALITSIVGMCLAVLLAIIQRSKDTLVSEDEAMILSSIDSQLSQLQKAGKHAHHLLPISNQLVSIDKNIQTLYTDFSSLKLALDDSLQQCATVNKTGSACCDNAKQIIEYLQHISVNLQSTSLPTAVHTNNTLSATANNTDTPALDDNVASQTKQSQTSPQPLSESADMQVSTEATIAKFESEGLDTDLSDIFANSVGELLTTFDDGTVRKTVVHLYDVSDYRKQGQRQKFHIMECKTLKSMRSNLIIQRYKKASRMDGTFCIIEDSVEKYEALDICVHCLRKYNRTYNDTADMHTFNIETYMSKPLQDTDPHLS